MIEWNRKNELFDKSLYAGIILNIIFYVLTFFFSPKLSDTFIILLSIGFFFNFILLFLNDIKFINQNYIIIFYLVATAYSLPFLSTYSLIEHYCSIIWIVHFGLSLTFTMILSPWRLFPLISLLGKLFAILLSYLKIEDFQYVFLDHEKNLALIYQTFFVFFLWYIFLKIREKHFEDKEEGLRILSSSIVHELNTPLSSMLINLKILNTRYFKSEETNTYLNKTIETLKETITLVDIMHSNFSLPQKYSKISAIDILDIIKEALEEFPLSVKDKSLIHLNVVKSFDVYIDARILKHVFFNLLKNAFFFIKKAGKGEIYIECYSNNSFHIISFKDTGYGIKPEFINHIFDRFFSKKRDGTGMGLFFCYKAMQQVRGKIECQSEFGQYTKFLLFFPKSKHESLK